MERLHSLDRWALSQVTLPGVAQLRGEVLGRYRRIESRHLSASRPASNIAGERESRARCLGEKSVSRDSSRFERY